MRLETIINDLKARLKHAPQGSLRLSKSHNHIQYYCCDEENKSGHYIPKDEFDLACKLAQKSYDKKALELADGRPDADFIGYFNTMLRYYLHVDPDTLTDQQWAAMIAQLTDIRKKEAGK